MKRTTIYLDEQDTRAIAAIQADHDRRGLKITAADAVRLSLREEARRLDRRTPRRAEPIDG